MKNLIKIVSMSFFCVTLVSCTKVTTTPSSTINNSTTKTSNIGKSATTSSEIVKEIIKDKTEENKKMEFKVVKELSEIHKQYINENKNDKGYIITDDGKTLIIFMGKKSSGGFSIHVDNVLKENNTVTVKVIENGPGANDMVTSALTYPYEVISFNENISNYELKVEGKEIYNSILNIR